MRVCDPALLLPIGIVEFRVPPGGFVVGGLYRFDCETDRVVIE